MTDSFRQDLINMEYDDFETFVALQDGDKALVIKVYDGDTLTIGFLHGSVPKPVRESVRIRGIDTPELRAKNEEEKRLAVLARERLEKVTMRKVVRLINPESDKYGRLLCDLATEDLKSVAEYMLRDHDICREYHGGQRMPWTSN